MKPDPKTCSECGAKMVTYKHSLNVPLVKGLMALHLAGGGPVNLNDLHLSYAERCNFQKLRYFGLVAQSRNPDGSHRRGFWQITNSGHLFAQGYSYAPIWVRTYRGNLYEQATAFVKIGNVHAPYQQQPVWTDEAEAVAL